MNKKLKAFLLSLPFLIAAGLVGFYFLFAYFAVDPLAKRLLPWVAERQLASKMTVDQVSFDPLRLELTVSGLHLNRADGGKLAGCDRLYLDLQADSLFRFAWHVRDIRVTKPYAQLEIRPDGKFNWADLLARLNENKTPSSMMPRVVIDHLQIEQGSVFYAEQNRTPAYTTELQPLALELGQFSTLPEDRGDYLIAAELAGHGGTLRWKGDVGVNPLASAGAIEIQGLKLDSLFDLLKQPAHPVTITGGALGLKLDYDFAMVRSQREPEPYPQLRMKQIAIELADLTAALNTRAKLQLKQAGTTIPGIDVKLSRDRHLQIQPFDLHAGKLQLQQDGKSLLGLERIDASQIAYDIAASKLDIASLALKQGTIRAARASDGSLDWSRVMPATEARKTEIKTADVKKAEAKTASTVKNSAVSDSKSVPTFRFDIADLRVDDWKASFTDDSFARPLQANVERINLRMRVSDAGNGPGISALNASLESLGLLSGGQSQPVAFLERASLSDGALNLNQRSVSAGMLGFSGLKTQVIVNADKSINWASLLQPAAPRSASASSAASSSASTSETRTANSPSPAWKATLQKLRLEKAAIHIEDQGTRQPVALDIQDGMVELADASLDLTKPVSLKSRLAFRQGGQLEASGKLSPLPAKGELQLNLTDLPLKTFTPYLLQVAALKLNDGKVAARGKLSFTASKAFSGTFAGGFTVAQLSIDEDDDGKAFLSWDALASDSLKVSIAPNRIQMNEIRVVNPVGRMIIHEDKSLNVQHLMREQPAAANTVNATSKASAKDATDKAFAVAVDRISIAGGDLEFADLSLRPQFGAQIHDLQGVINGLSTDTSSTALVELDGKVDDYGSARVRGSVQPFRATDFTDLNVNFRNLEMTRLTPYSGKFAGRKIDSGKLSVDLEYKIKNRKLVGENKFIINRLKLGERVSSTDAVNLPLDLAIALLEDSNGVIDINLPISGSLDDPQFSYGKIIWKAIVNVFEKVATAPFRALGKLLGLSSEQLGAIEFDPGSSLLAPPQQEKLKAVVEALAKRPALTLQIIPVFDPKADKAALQELTTRRDVIAELGLSLKDGELPGPVDVTNIKVQTAIENLIKDRSGEKRSLKMVDNVKDYFRQSKPEDVARYTAMLEQLRNGVKISEANLTELAKARAMSIQGYLHNTLRLDTARTSMAAPAAVSGNGKSVDVKMELGTARTRQ